MNKLVGVMIMTLVMLAACQPAPQPTPTASPTSPPPPATPSPEPTDTPTLIPTVTPTTAPTLAPTAQPTPTPTTVPGFQVQVDSPEVGYLNIRNAPSTSGELIAQAKDQVTLDVLEVADTARAKVGQPGQWLKVRTPEGKEGYAAAWYLRLPGASPAPAPSPTSVPRVPPTPMPNPRLDVVVELVNRTNALRAENGLPPYKLNDLLNASARRHSDDMASTGRIDHTGADGSTAKQRVLDTGYPAQLVGENIYGGQVTVDDAWNYWVNDPPHRAVLLNAQYVDIGISVVKGKGGWYFFTMDVARPVTP